MADKRDRFGVTTIEAPLDPPRIRKYRCANCLYFEPEEFRTHPPQCRKGVPTAALVPGPTGNAGFLGFWPPTREQDWCGEHVPIEGNSPPGGLYEEAHRTTPLCPMWWFVRCLFRLYAR